LDLWIDTEVYSPIALRNGTARYATQCEVMIVTWALDDEPTQCWDATSGYPMPASLYEAVMLCDRILAHNAWFDRTVLEHMDWWPSEFAPLSKWRCVMAQLLSHGLPGSLDLACKIFQIDASKSKVDGKKFINLFCKPQGKKKVRNTSESHPDEWAGFLNYAKLDIDAMRAVSKACPKWNSSAFERDLWHLDQTINGRGFAVDVELAHAAIFMTTNAKHELAQRTEEITGGAVESTTQRNRLLQFLLSEYNVALPDLKSATIEARLEDPELPEFVKELLRIRLQASKSSTSKYKRVAETEVGGRLYGTLQFAAALRTARWGGRLFQPQNLPRLQTELVADHFRIPVGAVKKKHIVEYLDAGIAALKRHDADLIFANVMGLASNAIRGIIVAPKGKKLVISDLSNIEGRKLAWLADEDWKIAAFKAFDAGVGADLYRIAYARAFGIRPEDVTDDQRQIGKVMELALGYQGGVGAFVSMVATYGIDLEELARKAWETIPSNTLRDAESAWTRAVSKRKTLGLSREVWVVCTALTWLWRNAHPNTVTLWEACEVAARHAILNPNTEFPVSGGKMVFDRRGNWLRIRLPSGRYLSYPDPKIEGNAIHYAAVSVYTKSWQRVYTYGGKIVENIDQASSRDVMAYAMVRAEKEGYKTVLTVHDELVTEQPDIERFNDKDLSRILATNETWNLGLPLAAKGFTTYRYRKD
jgi:DNA polymerase